MKWNVREDPNLYRKIKLLDIDSLKRMAEEIRRYIIEVVSQKEGHLASNLGAVELTLALYKVFDLDKDLFVWDVSHQCYTHKILTGRAREFKTIRDLNGLSGFTSRKESRFDVFGAGHASTSIAAGYGFATARDLLKETNKIIMVIGDGALAGGMALEALNQLGASNKRNVIIVLNDNSMSIARSVGAISRYLTSIRVLPQYLKLKRVIKYLLSLLPGGKRTIGFIDRVKSATKKILLKGSFFEDLGFRYFGPIDGHDLEKMISFFKRVKDIKEPIFVHVITKKGKGYKWAEANPTKYHGIGNFDVKNGEIREVKRHFVSYSEVFGKVLVELAKRNDKIVAITAAMPDGTGLVPFKKRFPERFFDLGMTEPTCVTFGGAMAAKGFKVFIAIYSTFLQRAVDQVIHDIALQNLNVIFAVDRAGVVGRDGPTHHGVFDIAYIRMIPNMKIFAPSDLQEFASMLKWAAEGTHDDPMVIRYPREKEWVPDPENTFKLSNIPSIDPMRWEVIREGKDICILACGSMLKEALKAAEELRVNDGMNVEVVNARVIKPLDEEFLEKDLNRFRIILTVEEGVLKGGFGSAVAEYIVDNDVKIKVMRLGIRDEFVTHGSRDELLNVVNLTKNDILKRIRKLRGEMYDISNGVRSSRDR